MTALRKIVLYSTNGVTTFVQTAMLEALKTTEAEIAWRREEYRKRRDYVVQRLRAIPGVKIAEPKGAFYAYPNISVAFRNGITSALQFAEKLLAESHVAVVPGEAFGTTEHIRISYATSMKELERGLDRIERFRDVAQAVSGVTGHSGTASLSAWTRAGWLSISSVATSTGRPSAALSSLRRATRSRRVRPGSRSTRRSISLVGRA